MRLPDLLQMNDSYPLSKGSGLCVENLATQLSNQRWVSATRNPS